MEAAQECGRKEAKEIGYGCGGGGPFCSIDVRGFLCGVVGGGCFHK